MSISAKPGGRISATEARVHFGEIYRRVTENDETIIIERNGKPGAVLLSIEEFDSLKAVSSPSNWLQVAQQAQAAFRPFLERNPDFDVVDVIREMRDERDEQVRDAVFGR